MGEVQKAEQDPTAELRAVDQRFHRPLRGPDQGKREGVVQARQEGLHPPDPKADTKIRRRGSLLKLEGIPIVKISGIQSH